MKKVLITGGTGLIGKAFIACYPDHEYTVLTRNTVQAARLLPANVRLISSLTNLRNLDAFDVVLNLAGEPIIDRRWNLRQKMRIRSSRWQTTKDLARLFLQSDNPPKVLISGSAIGYYGAGGESVLTEDKQPTNKEFATDLCQRWESIACWAEACTRVVLLRTGMVLASEGGALARMLLPFRCGVGARIGSGRQFISWIHRDDLVRAIAFLIENPTARSAFNLTSPHPVRNIELTNQLAKALNRRAVFVVPAFVMRMLMGEGASLLLDSQRVYPEKLLNAGFCFDYPQLPEALAALLHRE